MKQERMHTAADERIQDKAYDLLGEMILEKEANEVMQELEHERLSGNTEEMDAFFAERDRAYLNVIEKEYRKSRRRERNRSLVDKMTRIAALIVLGVFALGSVTIAASEDVRVQLMKILSWTTDQYTAVELVPAYENPAVPKAWEGAYYPGYIPQELSLAQCLPDTVTYWKDGNIDISVRFCEYTASTYVNLDTENAEISPVTIQGIPAQMIQKAHRIVILWSLEDRFFTVTTKGYDADTALRVANSVEIRK